MELSNVESLARFLVDVKLYMGLETSFGKSIESIVMQHYPIGAEDIAIWSKPEEKAREEAALKGLTREEKARVRVNSVWREIDTSSVSGDARYLVSIKSGPTTINDTQVTAMRDAVCKHYETWLRESQENYGVDRIEIVLGLTYGTPRTTNNKDNQLIAKLLECGFREEDRANRPGVLLDEATGRVRVYRSVGRDYWSFIARPKDPSQAEFAFLEVLLALALALSRASQHLSLGDRLNLRLQMLGTAISELRFPPDPLPNWMRDELSEDELLWLASALTAFYDQGV
jgi:hypothetical protein